MGLGSQFQMLQDPLLSLNRTERFGTVVLFAVSRDDFLGCTNMPRSIKSMFYKRLMSTASLFTSLAVLAGCTVGPNFVAPANALQDASWEPKAIPGATVAVSAERAPALWWALFNDPLLTELETKVQQNNLDVLMASNRIEQSRALLGITESNLQPNVAANAGYSRSGLSENGQFAALGAPTEASNFWQVGVDASWELDLWGRTRRASEGATAALAASAYDRDAIAVAVSAELARVYLQLRGTQAQLDITRQHKVIAQRALKLTISRERNGIATGFDTATARAQLAMIDAMLPELTERRDNLMNALALLLGEQPHVLDSRLRQAMPLPSLPLEIPVGVPSDLARRRPDILRAESQLHAATASIGVAAADFYPRIGLKGRVGVEAFESQDLSSWDSRFFSVGPTIYLPIFQGGRLTQRLELNEARQKHAALAYRQTVLRAWHEVDNALNASFAQQSRYAELQISFEQNKKALQIAERGYQEGAADYLQVLTAQRNLLASQTNLNTSATNSTLTLVNLYKALGGGWK